MEGRIFDVDFGALNLSVTRPAGDLQPEPTSISWTGNGANQIIGADDFGNCITYETVDLQQLTKEQTAFQPLGINITRPWTAPEGFDTNYMASSPSYEMLYVFQNALPNEYIRNNPRNALQAFRDMGLNSSEAGGGAQWLTLPNEDNTLFGQMSRFHNTLSNSNTVWNGMAVEADTYYPLLSQDMMTQEVNTWGVLNPILGPTLHCYRVIFHETQNLAGLSNDPAPGMGNPVAMAPGTTLRKFSNLSIKILAKDAKLNEGEYIVEASNAFNRNNFNTENER